MIVNAKVSSVQFIYPFLFDRVTFERRKDAISKAQWQSSSCIWRKASFPRDDLLAHVERYLNPPQDIAPTSLILEMDANTLQSPSGLGGKADWFFSVVQRGNSV
jgi:hypothetical protein